MQEKLVISTLENEGFFCLVYVKDIYWNYLETNIYLLQMRFFMLL